MVVGCGPTDRGAAREGDRRGREEIRRWLRRGVYISLEDLEASVLDFVALRNGNEAKPVKWTDSPGRLIAARQIVFQMTRTNH